MVEHLLCCRRGAMTHTNRKSAPCLSLMEEQLKLEEEEETEGGRRGRWENECAIRNREVRGRRLRWGRGEGGVQCCCSAGECFLIGGWHWEANSSALPHQSPALRRCPGWRCCSPPTLHPRDPRSSSYTLICSLVTCGLMGVFVHELTRKTTILDTSLWSGKRMWTPGWGALTRHSSRWRSVIL